jgi:hypothetical protein
MSVVSSGCLKVGLLEVQATGGGRATATGKGSIGVEGNRFLTGDEWSVREGVGRMIFEIFTRYVFENVMLMTNGLLNFFFRANRTINPGGVEYLWYSNIIISWMLLFENVQLL